MTGGAVAIAGFSCVACVGGDERSVEAFCDTIESEQERILDQFDAAGGNAEVDSFESMLAGLGASVQAIGELRTYFEKLAKVAPPEIQTEVEIVAREYDQMLDDVADAVDNPLGALVSGVMSSVEISGPVNTIDEYAVDNCGTHI